MEGTFEVTTTINRWEPPFDKTNTVVEYIGTENEEFDEDATVKGNVFRIVKLSADYAIISYDSQYTLKQNQFGSQELMIAAQTIKVPKNMELEFSYMWGSKGITKKIVYNGKYVEDNQENSETNGYETSIDN